jgi:hypothetical protein
MSIDSPATDFLHEVTDYFATYFDGAMGYQLNLERLKESQTSVAAKTGKSINELDQLNYLYITGDPNTSESKLMISTTQGVAKLRNGKDGPNTVFLTRMLIVAIYQLCEDEYRARFASVKGLAKNEITSELFGDLRRYRQSIVHNRAVAIAEVANNRILRWTNPGSPVKPSSEEIRELLFSIDKEIKLLGINES